MKVDVNIDWIFCFACRDRGLEDDDCKFHRAEYFDEERFLRREYECPRCKSIIVSVHVTGMTDEYAEHLKSKAEEIGGGGFYE